MKSILLSLTLLAAGLAAGCMDSRSANQPAPANPQTTATVKAATSTVVDASASRSALDLVAVTLKNISDVEDQATLRSLYGDLKDHASAFNTSLISVQTSGDAEVATGRTQISHWHDQAETFTDPDLRAASEKREEELSKAVNALAIANADLKNKGDAYRTSLGQVTNALDLDLSVQGVQTIKPFIGKIVDGVPDLKKTLAEVENRSKAIGGMINPAPVAMQ
jgi:hypothetical protein